MPKISNVSPVDCVKALKKLGFQEAAGGKGSHRKLTKDDKTIIVPTGTNPIPIGTVKAILRQAGITQKEFLDAV